MGMLEDDLTANPPKYPKARKVKADVRAGDCDDCGATLPSHYGSCSKVDPAMREALAKVAADDARDRAERRERTASIAQHMASLNLFKEPNGEYQITVADASGFIRAFKEPMRAAPIHYVERAIIEAADRIKKRHGL